VIDSAAGLRADAYARAAARKARDRVKALLVESRPGAVFTALRTHGELLVAEAALASGAELNVVLPTQESTEAEWRVAGESLARRFRSCCRKARRVVSVAEDSTADDSGLSDYAARVAMGLTLLRAQHLDGDAVQVVLGGVSAAGQPAIQSWRDSGRRQMMLYIGEPEPIAPRASRSEERNCSALIFGDLPGFSKMPEKYLPIFWDQVMGAIGEVLGSSKDAVALKNTWGDAIHCVIPDVRRAAEICLAVQRRLQAIDGRAMGRDDAPTMRIGAHYGPVFEGWDPVLAHRTFYGRALSRAARIEPITPPGTVYVTEAFAAILLLESRGEFTCTYVGQVPLAKGFGTFRMYDLSKG
jgi:class 3 adenylate cyclase